MFVSVGGKAVCVTVIGTAGATVITLAVGVSVMLTATLITGVALALSRLRSGDLTRAMAATSTAKSAVAATTGRRPRKAKPFLGASPAIAGFINSVAEARSVGLAKGTVAPPGRRKSRTVMLSRPPAALAALISSRAASGGAYLRTKGRMASSLISSTRPSEQSSSVSPGRIFSRSPAA